MAFDLEKVVSQIVSSLTGNSDLLAKFKADPIGTITKTLGIEIPDSQIKSVIAAVTSRLGAESAAAANGAAGILDKIKGFFKK